LGPGGQDPPAHGVGRTAQREREVLGVDLAQDELDRAVIETGDVLEAESLAADRFGGVGLLFGELVEHVVLGRASGTGGRSRITRSTRRATSGREVGEAGNAVRDVGRWAPSKPASTCAAATGWLAARR
jgi:hypothetical protein